MGAEEGSEETMEETTHHRRLAGAPISWGVCEVPGWGLQLSPERVLGEMRSLGLHATELGAIGWLPLDAPALRARLGEFGLGLVGGFVPVVLHEQDLAPARERVTRMAELFAAAGAEVLVAAVLQDELWGAPRRLTGAEWSRLVANLEALDAHVSGYGLRLAVHPHVGTLIEREADVTRLLEETGAGWCLDTGHLLIGGIDPVDFVREHGGRIAHVHLKDVDAAIAARLRAGELSLVNATQQGLFRPLGEGDARISEVIRALDDAGYERTLVLEQDTAITGQEPPAGDGPVLDVRRSIEYLTARAPEREVAQT
ncbi:MAG TPA: TIM barrel protein [Solirubrobacteraceae bacterium]|nr:TIM barrel protein [Solirubrobacteraceae bacterium]